MTFNGLSLVDLTAIIQIYMSFICSHLQRMRGKGGIIPPNDVKTGLDSHGQCEKRKMMVLRRGFPSHLDSESRTFLARQESYWPL